ncbi:sensor histidine kinase [Dyadobacter sp. CY107]|uniref:sensor histidine kinase n=1 Tax=Dyadobacter fanqingshengii TaxID=2906443 RepID=UPI001F191AB0|nr:sensor histidine kinase [Dyadobacter fanqingshengii]MCF2506006.1 sensor histidine kinase [Dyadobacter fanqingshengii]
MKKSVVQLLHLGYWFLYQCLFTFIFMLSRNVASADLSDWEDWLTLLTIATITGAASFYAFYSWLVPRYLTAGRISAFVRSGLLAITGLALAATVAVSLIFTLFIYVLFEKLDFFLLTFKDNVWLISGFALLAAANAFIGTVFKGFITWYDDRKEKEALISGKLRTELALLKAQINPHFLFNTLNNIDVLIEHNPSAASLYLNKLSDLLRYILYEIQPDWIPLSRELEYIKKYIDVQKIRTSNDEFVSLEINGPIDGIMIAPMVLVPFIENAFKHTTNKRNAGSIRISITVTDDQIHFQCINVVGRKLSEAPEKPSGLGNGLLKQRIALLYKDTHRLTLQETVNEYVVNLYLPIKVHELSAY